MTIRKLTAHACKLAAMSALSLIIFSVASIAWAQGPFHIEAKWQIGGDGGWDYLAVDPVSRHLYITRGNHVLVVDTHSGKQIADITGLHGTHGVAFDTNGKVGYISDGAGNQVAIFDRKTNQIVKTLPAGTNPDGIVFEPVTRTVWAFNGRSHTATVIDAGSQSVAATVPLPGKPEFPVADGKGSIFVNIEDKSEILHLDAKQRTALASLASIAMPEPFRPGHRSRSSAPLRSLRQQPDGGGECGDGQSRGNSGNRRWAGRSRILATGQVRLQLQRRQRHLDRCA